jgi:uncharacterized protein
MAEVAPLEFPCTIAVKVMGVANSPFVDEITALICHHYPTLDAAAITQRASRGGKYLALTAEVVASDRSEIDRLYQALVSHPLVVMAL